MAKHVQDRSGDGADPTERYFVKDTMISSPPSVPIPIIDFRLISSSMFLNEESDEMQKLKSVLSSWGCFQAVGHGVSDSFLKKMRDDAKSFFALPMEEKQKYSRTTDNMEGYGNDTIYSEKQVLDWSDRLFLYTLPEDKRMLNLWPETPSDFREHLMDYSEKIFGIMNLLLKAMARLLDLEESSFLKQMGDDAIMQTRFNYYPTCRRPDLVLGLKAHSDGSGVTVLLPEKEVEGLQVLKDDQWIMVPIMPNALIVNLGDQIQIMSNGIFKSPLHRVAANAERERISVVMFYFPNPEREIEPVKELVDDERPQLYRKLKNYGAINFESFQTGKIPLDTVKIPLASSYK